MATLAVPKSNVAQIKDREDKEEQQIFTCFFLVSLYTRVYAAQLSC